MTKVTTAWPDASWNIESVSSDMCELGIASQSEAFATPYGYTSGMFACGPTYANVIACKKDADGQALCIRSYADKSAVRFRTNATKGTDNPANSKASPIHVVLENGTTCDPISHDQTPHPAGRSSWLLCSDDSSLLTSADSGDENGDYFDTSEPVWTAQKSSGTNAPVTVNVKEVVFAG